MRANSSPVSFTNPPPTGAPPTASSFRLHVDGAFGGTLLGVHAEGHAPLRVTLTRGHVPFSTPEHLAADTDVRGRITLAPSACRRYGGGAALGIDGLTVRLRVLGVVRTEHVDVWGAGTLSCR